MERSGSSTPSGGSALGGGMVRMAKEGKERRCCFKISAFIGLILIQIELSQQIENDCH